MALLTGQYSTSNYKQVLIAAVPDKIILVARLCFTVTAAGSLTLLSDPNGGNETIVVPLLYLVANTTLDLRFGKQYAPSAARGKALGWTSTVGGAGGHSLMLWYEVVD